MREDKHLLISQKIHTKHKEQSKMWLGFSLLYLRQNIKPYTLNQAWAELENSTEKQSARASIDRT